MTVLLFVAALVCFLLASFGRAIGAVNLLALGLALLTLAIGLDAFAAVLH